MKAKYILGVDLGTSSVKTILIDSEGKIIGSASSEYPTDYPQPGWAEQNPENWYSDFKNTFGRMMKEAGISPERISAVGVAGQMVSLTCLDREGSVLRNTISWNDQRATSQVRWLKENFGKSISRITYLPINQSFTLPKLLWLRENEPLVWKQMYQLQLPKDYIRFRLTRNWFTDYSDASATMLFDPVKLRWSERICKMLQFPMGKLPEVVPSSRIVGNVCREASDELGIVKGTPVVAGASDLSADNLASGITRPNQWVTRMGTAGSTSLVVDSAILDKQGVCFCSVHCIPGKYIVEVGVHSFGQSYRWFKDTFCGEESSRAKEVDKSPYEIIEHYAEKTSIGADGLIFHPFINGSPYWDPYLKGVFWGIKPGHTKGHFSRAVLEGTAFCLSDAFGLLRNLSKCKPKEYILVGGGSRSRLWRQTICDVLGTDATVLDNCDASLGVAMLAGVGSSIFRDYEEAIEKFVKPSSKVSYVKENHLSYQKIMSTFKKIHGEIRKIYRELGEKELKDFK